MSVVVGIAVGGAAGAISRYGLDRLIETRSEALFPWATFVINVTGCLAVGLVIAALVDRHEAPAWLRAALVVGFLGGYTTFATFAQETLDLIEAGDSVVALANVLANVALGLVAVYIGARIGQAI